MTDVAISQPLSVLLVLSAVACLVTATLLFARRAEGEPARLATAVALGLSAFWALSTAAYGRVPLTAYFLGLSNLAWLWMTYRLFAQDGRHRSLAPIRPVVLAIALVEMLQFPLTVLHFGHSDAGIALLSTRISEVFHVLSSVGSLVLVHNLYAGAAGPARDQLRWPASALALLFLYDLNLHTVSYLTGGRAEMLAALRSLLPLAMAGLIAFDTFRPRHHQAFRPSRAFTFQSLSLLVIGLYFAVMALAYQGLTYLDGNYARLAQVAFLAIASAAALLILPSARMRGWLKVTLAKNLFQHRYDYREEWLRFTGTMGRSGPGAPPLRERVVQAVAELADSPAGLLLLPAEDGGFELAAQWQWRNAEVPARAIERSSARFYGDTQFILDLDEWRKGDVDGLPTDAVPEWLAQEERAWIVVPLLQHEQLRGLVILARPVPARRLDWEDFDLFRVVGQQLASYLGEEASQDALGEAQRFDEFNRRIAFVMHDIKNLASQLSLLARNAEKHADNPEFRADMLVTLRNSSGKLETLLSRLGRYGKQTNEAAVPTDLSILARDIASRGAAGAKIEAIVAGPVFAAVQREALDQALVHLVHNAVEASDKNAPVLIEVRRKGIEALIEVVDSGCGMSPDFIRQRLFKPFHSTKEGGFGIGAMEARELVQAMGGQLHVDSREGLGTRFTLRFPLSASVGEPRSASPEFSQKVA